MNPHPVHALDPVFEFLDGLIRDHGDTLFTVACYAAIPPRVGESAANP